MEAMDAPEIRGMERWGCLREETEPRCPVCGAACDWVYLYKGLDPVGCDQCLTRRDALNWAADPGEGEAECGRNR